MEILVCNRIRRQLAFERVRRRGRHDKFGVMKLRGKMGRFRDLDKWDQTSKRSGWIRHLSELCGQRKHSVWFSQHHSCQLEESTTAYTGSFQARKIYRSIA